MVLVAVRRSRVSQKAPAAASAVDSVVPLRFTACRFARVSDETNPAALVEHQMEWAQRAPQLLSGVWVAIDGLDGAESAALDHIGSTSVPGLAAKPFVDLQLRISPLPSETELVTRLLPFGYVRARGSRPDPPGVDRDLPRGSIAADPLVWEKLLFWHEDDHAILHVRRADSQNGVL